MLTAAGVEPNDAADNMSQHKMRIQQRPAFCTTTQSIMLADFFCIMYVFGLCFEFVFVFEIVFVFELCSCFEFVFEIACVFECLCLCCVVGFSRVA